MATSDFSHVYVRNPGKAAQQLAAKRKRIAELEAGAPARPFEDVAEHRKVAARLEQAFRDTGRCQDCGKPLTDPTSVARGIGPDCFARRQTPAADVSGLLAELDPKEAW